MKLPKEKSEEKCMHSGISVFVDKTGIDAVFTKIRTFVQNLVIFKLFSDDDPHIVWIYKSATIRVFSIIDEIVFYIDFEIV